MTPAPDPSSATAAGRGAQECCDQQHNNKDILHHSDLYTRTSWVDAALALSQIDKGKASGRRIALRVRAKAQSQLFQLGCFVQSHAGKVLFVAALLLASFSVGLKSAHVQTKVDRLWVEGVVAKRVCDLQTYLQAYSTGTNTLTVM
ncbi:hypothetical protein B566_EDAN007575 [Ephemera danica]|nr:hypothetical protein B566_EDAN007575 [Ephemera danica]